MIKKAIVLFFLLQTSLLWALERNWVQVDTLGAQNWSAIALSQNGLQLLAAYDNGYLHTSSDSGLTWTERTSSGQRNWKSVALSSDGTKAIAATQNGFIYTSSDSGVTWIAQTGSGQRNWKSVALSSDGKRAFATVQNGYIYTSSDSGLTWTERTSSGQRNWKSVAISSDGAKAIAAEQNGYLYTSSNVGASWTERNAAGKRGWYDATISDDGTKMTAADFGGFIYISTNSGSTWSERSSTGRKDWVSIVGSADGTIVFAAGYFATVYQSVNSGWNWTSLEGSMNRKWHALAISKDGMSIAGIDQGGHIYLSNPPLISSISATNPDGVYQVGDTITLDILFSEKVSTSGTNIILETGDTDFVCRIIVNNSDKAQCDYVVRKGDMTNELKLKTVQGTITDTGGTKMINFVPLHNFVDKKIVIKLNITHNNSITPTTPDLTCQKLVGLYRLCPFPKPVQNYTSYQSNLLCEGIITDDQADRKRKSISRYEGIKIAVNMRRATLKSSSRYVGSFGDVSRNMYPVVQAAMDQGLIADGATLDPHKSMNRIEAYTLLMESVCLTPVPSTDQEWPALVHEAALAAGVTKLTWEQFRPQNRVTRKEVFLLASRLADWADTTGGCRAQVCAAEQ